MGATISQYVHEFFRSSLDKSMLLSHISELKKKYVFFEKWSIEDIKFAAGLFMASSHVDKLREDAKNKVNFSRGKISESILASFISSARCNWKEYFYVIYQTEDHRCFQYAQDMKKSKHPCMQECACETDHNALKEWHKYQELQEKRRKDSLMQAYYDDSYTTGDENSYRGYDNLSDDDEEREDHNEEQQLCVVDIQSMTKQLDKQNHKKNGRKSGKECSSQQCSLDKNGKVKTVSFDSRSSTNDSKTSSDISSTNSHTTITSTMEDDTSTKYSYSNEKNSLQSLRTKTRAAESMKKNISFDDKLLIPLPTSFNPLLRNPIFFGYTDKKWSNLHNDDVEKKNIINKKEEKILKKKFMEKENSIVEYTSECKAKQENRYLKLQNINKMYEATLKRNKDERQAIHSSSISEDEKNALFRQLSFDESAAIFAHEKEETLNRLNFEKLCCDEQSRIKSMKKELENLKKEETYDHPIGDAIISRLRLELADMTNILESKSKLMEDEKEKLDAIKEDILSQRRFHADSSNRSMVIFAEGRLKEARQCVELALQNVEDQKTLLQRALRRKEQERKIISVFVSASSVTNTVSIVDLLLILSLFCNETPEKKIKFIVDLFDLNSDGILHKNEFTCLLHCGSKALKNIGLLHSTLDIDMIYSIYIRATIKYGINKSQGITLYETKIFLLEEIKLNNLLCGFLGIESKKPFSDLQFQQMSFVHMFEKGILNISDLKHYFAFSQQTSRPELNRENVIFMHKLALSMGAKDPLKPNYSRFLPQQRKMEVPTNIIPLNHGHLANFSNYQKHSKVEASIKIQNLFRGIQARTIAKALARKEAFFLALQKSIDEMKTKVLLEFEKKEKQKGSNKLKWDANIRMKQIKMKSMGKVLGRKECILHIIEEAQKDGEKKIITRFKELAVARGFESFSIDNITNLSKPENENKDSLSIPRSSEKKVTQYKELVQYKHRCKMVESAANDANSFDKFKSDFEFDELVTNIRSINNVMTLIKTWNILREFPSKRLLCQYTTTLSRKGELEQDLRNHFKVERDLPAVLRGLHLLVSGDLEHGIVNNTLSRMLKNVDFVHESFFEYKLNKEREKSNKLKENKNNDKGGKYVEEEKMSDCLNIPTKQNIETLENNMLTLQKSASQIGQKLVMVQLSLECKRWKHLYELKSQNVKHCFGAEFDTGYSLRQNWIERYLFAMRMEENNNYQTEMKYLEIKNLVEDFLDTASNAATIIVNEYFLPWSQKSLRPFSQRPADGRARACGRGDNGIKYRYKYRNIQFRVLTDIDGIFDGSCELSAKLGGHELRGSKEYFKCGIDGVVIPLQAVIDICGFRVLAVSELPISIPKYNDLGEIDSIYQEQILGVIGKGESVQNCDAELNLKMIAFASKLNLARHFVKGNKDMTSREIYCSADIKGFRDENNKYYLLNFWRCFPSENPSATKHLLASPRGMTIFSRMLRPEYVAKYGQPLSPDANCQIIFGVSDSSTQTNENEVATAYLIETLLSKFAERLSSLDLSNDIINGFRLDLTTLMHKEGINMRHLGLLRTKFWKKMKGTVNIFFQQTKIETNDDLTSEIKRGSKIKVCGEIYRVSTDLRSSFNSSEITIESRVTSESKNNQDAFTGHVSTETNSAKIRLLTLAEMVARTSKNLARQYMRYYFQYKSRIPAKTTQIRILTEFLNILTGVHTGSQSFWSNQLFHGIRQRFGDCAVSSTEQWGLLQETRSICIYIVQRFIDMMGIKVSTESMINLHGSKGSFRFRSSDIVSLCPRVKHNVVMKDISEALVSSFRFQHVLLNDYKDTVLQDKPVLYWMLSERDGSSHAHNFGTSGDRLHGIFSGNETFEQEGALQDINDSSIYFDAKKKCRVQAKSLLQSKSIDVQPIFTLEVWARVVGGKFKNRTAIMANFCSVVATRHEAWALIIRIEGLEIALFGPCIEYDVFHHIVGTYDGVKGTLYLNGRIYSQKNIEQEILKRKKSVREKKIVDQNSMQNEVSSEFLRLTKERYQTSTKKNKIISRPQTEILNELKAKHNSEENRNSSQELIKEQMEHKDVENTVKDLHGNESHKVYINDTQRKNSLSFQNATDAEYIDEVINKTICVGSSCETKKFSKGHHFFDGCLCHVAVYTHCLSADIVLMHWTMSRSITRKTDLVGLRSTADKKFGKIFHEFSNQTSIVDYFVAYICHSLQKIPGDDDTCHVDRVEQAVSQLIKIDCIIGLIKLLKHLPNEEKYARIACKIYERITVTKSKNTSLPLRDLCFLPFKFNLIHKNVAISASIFRRTLRDLSFASIYGTRLHWVPRLSSDNAIVSLVVEAYKGSNKNSIQFTKQNSCDDLNDSDFFWTIKNNPSTVKLDISSCINLSDTTLMNILTCLNFLEVLIIDDCIGILACCNLMKMQKLTKLKRFSARRCHNLSNEFIVWLIEGSKKLEYIDVQDCNLVTDDVMKAYRQSLGTLSTINISNCTSITDTGLNDFVSSISPSQLREFDLSWCSLITNKGLQSITKITSLRSLCVSGLHRCDNQSLKMIIQSCRLLEILNIEDVYLITDGCFQFNFMHNSIKPLHHLRQLNISNCSNITDAGIGYLSKLCHSLNKLSLSGLYLLTDKSFVHFSSDERNSEESNRGNLRSLSLQSCLQLTDESILRISESSKLIEEIFLDKCVKVTDNGIKCLSSCFQLKTLSLESCIRITNKALFYLAGMKSLVNLNIAKCSGVSDNGLESLGSFNQKLLTLNISNCRNLTAKSIMHVLRHCKDLRMLHVKGMNGLFSLLELNAEKYPVEIKT